MAFATRGDDSTTDRCGLRGWPRPPCAHGHDVRFPPACETGLVESRWSDDGPEPLRGAAQPGRALRWRVLLRRHHHRHLLPPELSSRHAEAGERPVLSDGRGGAGLGLPGVPAVPSRRGARLGRMERSRRRGRPCDAADRRRRGRPGGCLGARGAPGLQRAAASTADERGSGRGTTRAGPCTAGADRAGTAPDHRPGGDGHRLRGRVRERPAVQRHHQDDLCRHAERTAGRAPGASGDSGPVRRTGSQPGCGWAGASARLSGAVRGRRTRRLPSATRDPRRRGGRRPAR